MRFSTLLATVTCLVFSLPARAEWFDDYRTLNEYNAKIDEFATDFPALTTSLYDRTVMGRPGYSLH